MILLFLKLSSQLSVHSVCSVTGSLAEISGPLSLQVDAVFGQATKVVALIGLCMMGLRESSPFRVKEQMLYEPSVIWG